ncbi:MAG: hypothetical protein GXP56_13760 [Deltaproteobacteria bacterium]|nr:hypothetical protein [Deltaproteobacteria bacterium]
MGNMKSEDFTFDEYETVYGEHGRIETRKYTMTSDIEWLYDKEKWAGFKSIGIVESTREIKGEYSHEKRYYISSPSGVDIQVSITGQVLTIIMKSFYRCFVPFFPAHFLNIKIVPGFFKRGSFTNLLANFPPVFSLPFPISYTPLFCFKIH